VGIKMRKKNVRLKNQQQEKKNGEAQRTLTR
jgi:hypothetical protein